MKMKILALLLVVAISILAFAACTPDEPDKKDEGVTDGGGKEDGKEDDGTGCKHTFSEAWSSDKTSHWHQATCEHGEIKNSLANHSDADEDGFCDVCEYEVGHDHRYAKEWSFDEENHWKAATCTHTDEIKDEELHSDEDDDGKCDVCEGHVHNANDAGFCKFEGCGKVMKEINEESLQEILDAIFTQSALINGGNITFVKTSPSANSDRFASSSTQTVKFVFGKSHAYYDISTNSVSYDYDTLEKIEVSDRLQLWHEADGEETFGVQKVDDEDLQIVSSDLDKLTGYYFNASSAVDGHGTETFLYNLFNASQAANASGYTVTYDAENNKVTFVFNVLNVQESTTGSGGYNPDFEGGEITEAPSTSGEKIYNVNYYEFEVSFTYDANFALTALDVVCDRYTNDPGVDGNEINYADVDIEYDPITGTFRFVKYNPNTGRFDPASSATPDTYSYSVTQTVGARDAENENPKSKFIPDTFDLFLDEARTEKVEGTVTRTNHAVFRIYAENSIDFVFDLITFDILDAEGNIIEGVDIMEGYSESIRASFTFDTNGRHFMLAPKVDGSFTLVVYYQGQIAHQVTIVVE